MCPSTEQGAHRPSDAERGQRPETTIQGSRRTKTALDSDPSATVTGELEQKLFPVAALSGVPNATSHTVTVAPRHRPVSARRHHLGGKMGPLVSYTAPKNNTCHCINP